MSLPTSEARPALSQVCCVVVCQCRWGVGVMETCFGVSCTSGWPFPVRCSARRLAGRNLATYRSCHANCVLPASACKPTPHGVACDSLRPVRKCSSMGHSRLPDVTQLVCGAMIGSVCQTNSHISCGLELYADALMDADTRAHYERQP